MNGGYMGRIAWVDLTRRTVEIEPWPESWPRSLIGGYGLGVRALLERQPAGADPLGPEAVLGFTTGPLTGTQAPTGGRYMACGKSPLTGGWGDANAGGRFGAGLKSAGFDALFATGVSDRPVWLEVDGGRIVFRDAHELWGRDAIATEAEIRRRTGDSRTRVACIGPASERLSRISGIVNDGGRIAARSGLGAVMGAKKLKAVAVHGEQRVPVARPEALGELARSFAREIREMPGMPQALLRHGTCGFTGSLLAGGATPVKNWRLAGERSFPGAERITDPEAVIRYQKRKYACSGCPIGCGGICEVTSGPYPVGEIHKPEYETLAAFGPLCLCNDLEAVFKLQDLCNRSGLDTISAGHVLAFAIECVERGVLSAADTDGIRLAWGDAAAMIALLERIIRREGIGDLLADGVRAAAERIGRGAEECAVHVGGQEPGLHNPLFLPGRGTGFVCDPTPGRHTAAPMARLDGGAGAFAPYPELRFGAFERYVAQGKGPMSARASCYLQVGNCAGVCIMPFMFFGNYPLIELLNAVTGWTLDVAEAIDTGARIQTLRLLFNLREGIDPTAVRLPDRLLGRPPQAEGPLAGVSIDLDPWVRDFRREMGWDPETGRPLATTLARLNIAGLADPR